MSYVIQRTDGAFVAPAGNRSSYTRELQHARTWGTREAAERERDDWKSKFDIINQGLTDQINQVIEVAKERDEAREEIETLKRN